MAEEQQNVTQQEAQQHSQQMFTNTGEQQYKQYVDDQIYVTSLAQGYLNRIEKDTEKAKFVTFARGIIAEVEASKPGAKVTRSGEYTYKQVFDLAYETLFPTPKEEEKPVAEAPATPEPVKQQSAPQAPPNRRVPGDIQPVRDGDEMEGYEEMMGNTPDGVQRYADLRNQLRDDTKTLKTTRDNTQLITQRLKEIKEKALNG